MVRVFCPTPHQVLQIIGQIYGGAVMSSLIQHLSDSKSLQLSSRTRRSRRWQVLGLLSLSLCASMTFAGQASAGPGCDLNVRLNNHTKNAVAIDASDSGASKSGLNVWGPLKGMIDTVLDPKDSGSASHSKQGVELKLPCWTGKVDFRIRYLDGSSKKWVRRDAVKLKSGETIQINIKN